MAPTGPLLSDHMTMPGDVLGFAIAFSVEREVTSSGRVVSSEVPAFRVARTVYRGQREGLGSAWGALQEWINANGQSPQNQMFERYLVGPGETPDPAKWQTEVNWPLAWENWRRRCLSGRASCSTPLERAYRFRR